MLDASSDISDVVVVADPSAAKVSRLMDPTHGRRSALARPRRLGWRDWISQVCAELRALRAPDLASALLACGRLSWVTPCDACGEQFARVEVRASCDVRVCPYCARRRSAARCAAVGEAIGRLPQLIDARRESARAAVAARIAEHKATRDDWRATAAAALARRAKRVHHWTAIRLGALRRASDVELAPSVRRAASGVADRAAARIAAAIAEESEAHFRAQHHAAVAESRRRVASRELHAIRESEQLRGDGGIRRGRWRWRLVTISPRWTPADPAELTPAGLRRRIDDALARWGRCWKQGVRAGGLAAAYASAELSPGGHVHVHVLYLGPWVDSSWWRSVAGCHVDVREVDETPGADASQPAPEALREALKYALKSPSPMRRDWIAGKPFEVAHPRLAAAWVVATRHHQIARAYGSLRAVLDTDGTDDGDAATDAAEDSLPRVVACADCGAALTRCADPMDTAHVARVLGSRWTWSTAKRAPGEEKSLREQLRLPPLPPRVSSPRM